MFKKILILSFICLSTFAEIRQETYLSCSLNHDKNVQFEILISPNYKTAILNFLEGREYDLAYSAMDLVWDVVGDETHGLSFSENFVKTSKASGYIAVRDAQGAFSCQ